MKWVLYLLFLSWISLGCCYILYTQEVKKFFFDLLKKYDNRLIAFIPGVVGLLLLAGAFQCRNTWFVILLGLVSVGKGLLFFFNPKDYAEKLKQWYFELDADRTYRLFGIIALIIGTAMISWIQ